MAWLTLSPQGLAPQPAVLWLKWLIPTIPPEDHETFSLTIRPPLVIDSHRILTDRSRYQLHRQGVQRSEQRVAEVVVFFDLRQKTRDNRRLSHSRLYFKVWNTAKSPALASRNDFRSLDSHPKLPCNEVGRNRALTRSVLHELTWRKLCLRTVTINLPSAATSSAAGSGSTATASSASVAISPAITIAASIGAFRSLAARLAVPVGSRD